MTTSPCDMPCVIRAPDRSGPEAGTLSARPAALSGYTARRRRRLAAPRGASLPPAACALGRGGLAAIATWSLDAWPHNRSGAPSRDRAAAPARQAPGQKNRGKMLMTLKNDETHAVIREGHDAECPFAGCTGRTEERARASRSRTGYRAFGPAPAGGRKRSDDASSSHCTQPGKPRYETENPCVMVRTGYLHEACITNEGQGSGQVRGTTLPIGSRRLGCRRASNSSWHLALSLSQQHALRKKKLFTSSRRRSWPSRPSASSDLLRGRAVRPVRYHAAHPGVRS
ncbi:hypothetical protein PMES_02312 [Profundibacterium mesophilum KAUST100406-0324]|uniref:Uncharacterized protein n=1 Tax=Profundibacterium mesophilum KAUST100406-0324 TaxID=1037889 RepID=A0A921NQJ9_9RHOB|nr:hypothetical protein PMES_02312 [Profundibacterium mesophilum KAUST100406-0324]